MRGNERRGTMKNDREYEDRKGKCGDGEEGKLYEGK